MQSFFRHLAALAHVGSANIGQLECIAIFSIPFLIYLSDADDLKHILLRNFQFQFLEFVVLVQFPLALTGKMAYVDLGWPLGLIILGLTGIRCGNGWYWRRFLIGGCMVLHGSRMFLGVFWCACVLIYMHYCNCCYLTLSRSIGIVLPLHFSQWRFEPLSICQTQVDT